MNFIEHLTEPKISFYYLDIAPVDSETFYQQIVFVLEMLFLFLDFMNNKLIANY